MTKKLRQKLNNLENKKSFYDEIKSIFEGLSMKQIIFFGRRKFSFKTRRKNN